MKIAGRLVAKSEKCKPNKICVDKGTELHNNRSMKSWLHDNDIEIYLIHNERKPVAAEICIRTLKNKLYKHIKSISKNVYIDKLNDIVGKYNDTYLQKIKIKPVNIRSSTYFNFEVESNDKDPKFKVLLLHHVRI